MRQIISLLMENEAGALSRVAGLFSAATTTIGIIVGRADRRPDPVTHDYRVTSGSDAVIEQINKQLNKLVDVALVMDLSEGEHLERELMLVKVRAEGDACNELKRMADAAHGRIIDTTWHIYAIELTGSCAELDSFLETIGRDLILETARTRASGIGYGDRILKL